MLRNLGFRAKSKQGECNSPLHVPINGPAGFENQYTPASRNSRFPVMVSAEIFSSAGSGLERFSKYPSMETKLERSWVMQRIVLCVRCCQFLSSSNTVFL